MKTANNNTMNTNTTTNNRKEVKTMKNTNLEGINVTEAAAAVMETARKMYRSIVKDDPSLRSRAQWSICLRQAWSEYGLTAAEIWENMTGEAQREMLIRFCWYEYKHDAGRYNAKTGKNIPPIFYWLEGKHPAEVADYLEEVANSAWCRIAVTIYDADEKIPLSRIVSRAIKAEAAALQRAELKHASAIRSKTDPETGEERSVIDTKAGAAAAHMDGPERAAILSDLIDRACKDAADRLVIADRIAGYTQTETGDVLGIGQRTIAKRLDGIRDRLADDLGRDPREKKAPRGKNPRK